MDVWFGAGHDIEMKIEPEFFRILLSSVRPCRSTQVNDEDSVHGNKIH